MTADANERLNIKASSSKKKFNSAYRITSRGESGMEVGVPGKIIEGDPALEYSNE